jgi:hypothetical protein
VDHHGVDVAVVLDAGEQCLQLGAVGGAGRLAAVGVFIDQLPALVANVADAGLALGGDRESLVGLFLGGDPSGR